MIHGMRGYPSPVAGTDYAAVSVGDDVQTDIVHIGDDPDWGFVEPAHVPHLPTAVVEQANIRHRKAYRARKALSRAFDFAFEDHVYEREQMAAKRILIAQIRRRPCALAHIGGFIELHDATPYRADDHITGDPQTDWCFGETARYARLRALNQFADADALRRDLEQSAGCRLFTDRRGTTFVNLTTHIDFWWNAAERKLIRRDV